MVEIPDAAPFLILFFSEPEPFVGLAFFFVCTDEKGLEGNEYG